ncbi:hypothetical protein B296_00023097 [Ensete ventricosum]|uniref:RRM domain-containing protein n=1 Tax=Ensete ventricosum TaxID=4639 RepID=A0A427AX83_ENSVE|nr:hypothetical protein B296_00023097 [Ensete ventricosum]
MAHRLLRDAQADGWERSDFPIICESCLGDNPYIRMTKADYDKECKICKRPFTVFRWRPGRDARYKKTEICQTCCKLKNVCQVCVLDLEYGLPVQVRDTALAINSNDAIPKSDVNREYFAEEHDRKAGEMPSLNTPEDESIKTLYVGGLDARISEQDLRDHFYAHGEIESIRMVVQRACAFVTYTTRDAAEKAAEELANKLVVKGLRLKLMWGRPQASKPEGEAQAQDDDAGRQGVVTHAGLLPRAVISQQQSNHQPLPPGTENHQQPPLNYFNIPAPPQAARTFYPSADPQRMGALVPTQEGSDNKSGSEKQPEQQAPNVHGHAYPMAPPHLQGSHYLPPYYPPYGYMAPPPPPYQQYPPYPPMMMAPRPPPQPAVQQYPQGPPGPSQS